VPRESNVMTPPENTYERTAAGRARYVADANEALASLRELGGRWWHYTVSHRAFQLVVGDPLARGGNLYICMGACEHIGGPVHWSRQQLHVMLEDNVERDGGCLYTLTDDRAKFTATGRTFYWKRDYDLHARRDAGTGGSAAG
jgi:hypothetical protein